MSNTKYYHVIINSSIHYNTEMLKYNSIIAYLIALFPIFLWYCINSDHMRGAFRKLASSYDLFRNSHNVV